MSGSDPGTTAVTSGEGGPTDPARLAEWDRAMDEAIFGKREAKLLEAMERAFNKVFP